MRKALLLAGALVTLLLTTAGCGGGGSGGGGNGANSATAAVVPPTIEVFPASLTVPPGTTQQFSATQVSADGSKADVTAGVTWSSSNTTVATVSNDAASKGLVTAVGSGTAKISATTSAGISGSSTLTVVELSSIAITPAPLTLPAGVGVQLTATGTFSDNSTADLTNFATWSSSAGSVATVGDASGAKGTLTTVAPGTATITATLAGKSGSSAVTVTTATLTSIALDQGHSTIVMAIGTIRKLSATGSYSDGSTHDVTTSATWTSSTTAAATVGTPDGGLIPVTAVAPGDTVIRVALSGSSDSVPVHVTSATLVSILVAPPTPMVGVGIETVQMTAIGSFSDNTAQDVTETVTWNTSDANVAVASNAAANTGEVTPNAVGKATITATMPLATPISASSVVTVTAPEPTVNSVSPTFGPIGQQVHVRGTNFMKGLTTVTIGGITQVPAQIANSSFLTFTVPAGVTSSTVTVVTPKGSATSTDVFTVGLPNAPPKVTGFSPAIGPVGQTVTVHGENFILGETRVFVGGVEATATVLDVNTIVFSVPAGAPGASSINVTTSLGSDTSTDTFTVGTPAGAPTVTGMDYTFGPPGAYRIVTGTNFVFGATTVNVGGVSGIKTTVSNPNTLSFVVPTGMLGNTKVTVVTPAGSADSPEVFIATKR